VINASFQAKSNWLAAVGLFVGLLTVFSMSKIWIEAFWKSPPPLRPAQRSVPCLLLVPIAMLGLLTLWIGLQPESLVRYATAAADALLNPQAYVGAVLGGSGASGGVP
jgi:multicomponent Na+:H+ antiporter subunit D